MKTSPMYCNNCGKINPSDSKFCQHCGFRFIEEFNTHIDQHIGTNVSSEYLTVDRPPYPYVISGWKLFFLSVLTFSLYDIYWFYRQWKSFIAVRNQKYGWLYISFLALFAGFSSFSLFRIIAKETKEVDPRKRLEATALAIMFLLLNFLYRLPSPYWLLSSLSIFALLPDV